MKAALAVVAGVFAFAAPAHATGWYDENGYHFQDEPGDVCYEKGGVVSTEARAGTPIDGIPTWEMVVTCGNGEVFVVEAGYGLPPGLMGEYVPDPPADEAWQQDYCIPPDRKRAA